MRRRSHYMTLLCGPSASLPLADYGRVARDTTAIDQMVAGDRPFRAELVVRFPTRSEQVPQHCTRYFR